MEDHVVSKTVLTFLYFASETDEEMEKEHTAIDVLLKIGKQDNSKVGQEARHVKPFELPALATGEQHVDC